jgi:RNA polymerase sigma-54 factor
LSAMEMHLRTEQKMLQRLQMSPQMYQTIEILQLALPDLTARIEEELVENPLLDRCEGALDPAADYGITSEADLDIPSDERKRRKEEEIREYLKTVREEFDDFISSSRGRGGEDDEDPKLAALMQVAAPSTSLQEHLLVQVRLLNLSDRDRRILENLIGALDRRGWLPRTTCTYSTPTTRRRLRTERRR